ncbi:MAG: hypothetical protein ACOYOH_15810 [Paracraurococcus sp.]
MRALRLRRGGFGAGLLICLLGGGCAVPEPLDPVAIYNRVSGKDDETRLPPPGMDRPLPNLASIPPRPERPPLGFRQSVTDALANDRASARDPLVLRSVPAPGASGGALAGEPPMPAAPPRRANLAAAPGIPWGEAPARPRALIDGATMPAAPAPTLPEMPAEAPAAPPAELLGPPPLPR